MPLLCDLQFVNVTIVLGNPNLDTAHQMWSHKCQTEANKQCPLICWLHFSHAAQHVLPFPGTRAQGRLGFCCLSTTTHGWPQLVLLQGVISSKIYGYLRYQKWDGLPFEYIWCD